MIDRSKTWGKQTAWPILQRTFKEWGNDDCSRLAASLAYYAVFSIFPLMLLMISLLGFWLRFSGQGDGVDVQEQLLKSIGSNISRGIADSLKTVLVDVKLGAGGGSAVAFVTVLFAASNIFTQLDGAFDRIWNVPQPETSGILNTIKTTLIDRGKAFLLVMAIGVLLIGSVVVTTVLNALSEYTKGLPASDVGWKLVNLGVGMLLNTLVFALLFFYLPKPKCRWSDVLPGALLTAVLWEIGKQGISFYLGRSSYTAYATVGAFIILMLWIYYASHIVFFGAEFSQVYAAWRTEQAEKALGLPALPPQPDLPFVRIPSPQATAQQKSSYAIGGAALGIAATLLVGALGLLGGVARLVKRR